jgi:hypothetical protein
MFRALLVAALIGAAAAFQAPMVSKVSKSKVKMGEEPVSTGTGKEETKPNFDGGSFADYLAKKQKADKEKEGK